MGDGMRQEQQRLLEALRAQQGSRGLNMHTSYLGDMDVLEAAMDSASWVVHEAMTNLRSYCTAEQVDDLRRAAGGIYPDGSPMAPARAAILLLQEEGNRDAALASERSKIHSAAVRKQQASLGTPSAYTAPLARRTAPSTAFRPTRGTSLPLHQGNINDVVDLTNDDEDDDDIEEVTSPHLVRHGNRGVGARGRTRGQSHRQPRSAGVNVDRDTLNRQLFNSGGSIAGAPSRTARGPKRSAERPKPKRKPVGSNKSSHSARNYTASTQRLGTSVWESRDVSNRWGLNCVCRGRDCGIRFTSEDLLLACTLVSGKKRNNILYACSISCANNLQGGECDWGAPELTCHTYKRGVSMEDLEEISACDKLYTLEKWENELGNIE